MDICFAPSLEHLALTKIVTSLFNAPHFNLKWNAGEEKEHYRNIFNVKELASKLPLFDHFKAKLEDYVTPVVCEVENWLKYCEQNWMIGHQIPLPASDIVRQCWSSDGSIDREKAAKILVKKNDINPINRFVFACIFCMFHDILDLWDILSNTEKVYLQYKYREGISNSDFIVKQWMEWLDSSTNLDWKSFALWAFQHALWKSNVYIMKHVFQTSSPVVRSHYLLEAFHGREVNDDVKRFGLTIMSREEREVILRKSPVEFFKCFLSWPLRTIFINLTDNLWPYITTDTFCGILDTILSMIKDDERDYVDLLLILKNFWAQSPSHCKKAAEKVRAISRPLNFVLNYDFSKKFSRRRFVNSFKPPYNHLAVHQVPPFAEFLRNDVEEDYFLYNIF